ncbi:MAG: hypothetical protein RR846_08305 [Oscillospiraceae bacterium]
MGKPLTASVSGQQKDATLVYKWTGGTTIFGTDSTLTLTDSMVGKTITLEVTAAGYEDSLTVSTSTAVAKKTVTITATAAINLEYNGTKQNVYTALTVDGDKVPESGLDFTYTCTDKSGNNTMRTKPATSALW